MEPDFEKKGSSVDVIDTEKPEEAAKTAKKTTGDAVVTILPPIKGAVKATIVSED